MKREAGFTLTELMITMAIVVILLGIGVPSYRYVTTANRVTSEINGLLGDIQFARSEAIREGQNVVLCQADANYTACTNKAASWNGGWLVWSDLNNDGTLTAGKVLRLQQAFTTQDTLQADAISNLGTITFNREGFAIGVKATLTLHDSSSNPTYTRCLDISPVGIPTTSTHLTDPTNCI